MNFQLKRYGIEKLIKLKRVLKRSYFLAAKEALDWLSRHGILISIMQALCMSVDFVFGR